jgi:hypothetical protein
MAIPADVYHVRVGGSRVGGEQWETGFWVSGATPTSNSEANALAALWLGQLMANDTSGAIAQSSLHLFAATTTIDYVRVYCYPGGGSTAQYIGVATQTPATGPKSQTCPNQAALVVSLRTELAGRQHRGRMYLPLDTLNGGSGAQLSTTDVIAVSLAWATCFTDWNASGDNGTVVVVSRVGAGAAVPVTDVVVDGRADTQRRRANKQAALTTSAHVVTST